MTKAVKNESRRAVVMGMWYQLIYKPEEPRVLQSWRCCFVLPAQRPGIRSFSVSGAVLGVEVCW